jgi:NUMOD3 motif-containing protein
MKTFYTYLWLREDGTPYYVGKGNSRRAFESIGHTVKRPRNRESIIVQEFSNESDAFTAERFLVAFYGRLDRGTGCLRNRTDGGDGPSGLILSEEAKEKCRTARLGKSMSASARQKISEATRGERNPFYGRKHSPETIEILRKKCRHEIGWNRGLKGFGTWNRGLVRSEESKEKNRLAHLGKKASAETRRKQSESLKGRFVSPETREKIRTALRLRAQRLRAA